MPTYSSSQLFETLYSYFGYKEFRPLQQKIIEHVLDGQDILAILPTGGGKSMCFQIPGILLGGSIVVISPLISLMQDQIAALKQKNIPAVMLSSTLTATQKNEAWHKIKTSSSLFIYLSAEQLNSKRWLEQSKKLHIPLVVVDEAHCISQWGHDFRPAHLHINNWISQLPTRPTVAAFTATATSATIRDIVNSLALSLPKLIIESKLPEHLWLHMVDCPDDNHKLIRLLQILNKHQGQAGIIYTTTRKSAEQLAAFLQRIQFYNQWGSIAYYHGGMDASSRQKIQEQFLSNSIQIITATNAFGMGVDKPNIRYVIHYQIPSSIEAYSQEVGRAGRDRKPASCYLFWHKPDLKINQELVSTSKSKINLLKRMVQLATSKSCLKKQLADYFSLKFSQLKCAKCSNCLPTNLASSNDITTYHELLRWRAVIAKKIKFEPSFILSQQQAALLTLLKPKNKNDFLTLPSFGNGWILRCWPLLKNGKIGDQSKEFL